MSFKKISLLPFILLFLSCTGRVPHNGGADVSSGDTKDTQNYDSVVYESLDHILGDQTILIDIGLYSAIYQQYCLEDTWVQCPPWDELWFASALIDKCDGNKIIQIGPCEFRFECDPSVPYMGFEECEMEDGSSGKRDVICDKGVIVKTDCALCEDEVCDGKDNDCDGEIDEGEWTCSSDCGPGEAFCIDGEIVCLAPEPEEEICNGLDDDCDGDTDEGQTNACGKCGPLPIETCNGIDDDCDGDTDEDLIQECFTICESGFEVCINGTWSVCSAQQPEPEICDGIDNDCNGQIDDGITCECTIDQVGILIPCWEEPLVCGQGYKMCQCKNDDCGKIELTACAAMCSYFPIAGIPCDPTGGMIIAELCNNWDDNCNELIDEDLMRDCYSGPDGTVGIGICKPGKQVCDAGVWGEYNDQDQLFTPDLCDGEVLPLDQELCNGLDDDCDGTIEDDMQETDIVFIVDMSGSMMQEINAILSALTTFSANYSDQTVIHWSLIIGPIPPPASLPIELQVSITGQYLKIDCDLTEFPVFLNALASLPVITFGSQEMLLDALYLAIAPIADVTVLPYLPWANEMWWTLTYSIYSDPPINSFHLNWREDAEKVIIVFTDEKLQTYLKPLVLIENIVDMINSIEDLRVYSFSPPSLHGSPYVGGKIVGFGPLTAAGEVGKSFDLTTDAQEMFEDLMEILDSTACE
tara:strand:+ start:3659 stop:5746 length:2088 start_codon:yes stop_codon:yes gene_type:complete